MSTNQHTYAIGDVQGCFDELQALLQHIGFNPEKDGLWFVGDLVNRGPKSLEVLRFIKSLPNAIVVLGNHDLHLLAVAANGHPGTTDTFTDVIHAPDAAELINWLRKQPLLHHDAKLGFVMTHAGLLPSWTLEEAKTYANELETALRDEHYQQIFIHLYGNQPNQWSRTLTGWNRLRFIANALTRMRFCDQAGRLNFNYSGPPGSQPTNYIPWYEVPDRKTQDINVIFGHWAALNGNVSIKNLYALDTGCIWGNCLTALRLEDTQRFSVRSRVTKLCR